MRLIAINRLTALYFTFNLFKINSHNQQNQITEDLIRRATQS